MWQWLPFVVGMIVGGFVGILVTCICVAAAREDQRMAERYERYLEGR